MDADYYIDSIIFCPDGDHDWIKYKNGSVLDVYGDIVKECTKCGQFSDWMTKDERK